MTNSSLPKYRLNFKPPVLPTESEDDFYALYSALEQHINPTDPIAAIKLNEIAASYWEETRMQRCKTNLLVVTFPKAIPRLFDRLGIASSEQAKPLAKAWFESEDGRKIVNDHLAKMNLDEKAIDAVSFELCSKPYMIADNLQRAARHDIDRALQDIVEFGKAFDASQQQDVQGDGSGLPAEQSALSKSDAA
jgi:hypothetical protein